METVVLLPSPQEKVVPPEVQSEPKPSYFRKKYAGRVSHLISIDRNHPHLSELQQSFDKHIVSQQKAKGALAEAVLDSIFRIGEPRGPLGVFFFHGPTGVGKTEIVKALAETIFGDPNGFIKINCENLSDRYTGSNLFGSPKGYIGYDEKTPFTNENIMRAYDVAKKTNRLNRMVANLPWINILLFDEIEKAHPEVIQQLLGLIDEGKATTSKGELVNFQNSIIIFTSNIGQGQIGEAKNRQPMGFGREKSDKSDINEIFKSELKKTFKPEFVGRIHSFVEFEELSKEDCKEIIDVQVQRLNRYLLKYFSEANVQFELSPNVYNFILETGYSPEKGARELVRTYKNLVERYLARLLNSSEFTPYYSYKGEVLIGIDIGENEELTCEIILKSGTLKKPEIKLLGFKSEKLSLERLSGIYAAVSAYTELTYVNLDGDIDMKDEIAIYAEKLRSYGLSQEEISSLKNRAYLEGLRDWAFIQYFEEISFGGENLFAPYEPRTIMKIVERKIEKIHNEGSKLKGGFIEEVIKGVMEIILRLMRKDELSGSQINQLLLHIKKVLSEKYQIHEL